MPEPILSNNYQTFCKDKGGLSLYVRAAILPLYNDLCKRENLPKCLDGRTQNSNESFNGMIWNRVPILKDMNTELGDQMMNAAYRMS